MFDPVDFDPDLAGLWMSGNAGRTLYGTGADPGMDDGLGRLWLETKAAAAPSSTGRSQALLDEMMTELKLQFEAFRSIRVGAQNKLGSEDDGEQKIAKADLKSASDALSLIVRTMEKIDSLQRSFADDRERAAETVFSAAAYDALLASVHDRIAQRAAELAGLHASGIAVAGDTVPP